MNGDVLVALLVCVSEIRVDIRKVEGEGRDRIPCSSRSTSFDRYIGRRERVLSSSEMDGSEKIWSDMQDKVRQ